MTPFQLWQLSAGLQPSRGRPVPALSRYLQLERRGAHQDPAPFSGSACGVPSL